MGNLFISMGNTQNQENKQKDDKGNSRQNRNEKGDVGNVNKVKKENQEALAREPYDEAYYDLVFESQFNMLIE